MWTRRLCPGLILVAVVVVPLLTLNFSLAGTQILIGPGTTVTPPRPMAAIEFVQDAGVDRWQVKLTRAGATEDVYLRISGPSACSFMDEVYKGMVTPLYEDMTFKTKSGRTCTVQAIER